MRYQANKGILSPVLVKDHDVFSNSSSAVSKKGSGKKKKTKTIIVKKTR